LETDALVTIIDSGYSEISSMYPALRLLPRFYSSWIILLSAIAVETMPSYFQSWPTCSITFVVIKTTK